MTIIAGSLVREYENLATIAASLLPKLKETLENLDIKFENKDSILKALDYVLPKQPFVPFISSAWESLFQKAIQLIIEDIPSIVEDFSRENMGCVRMLIEFLLESPVYSETMREIGRKIKIPEIGSILELNSGTGRGSLEVAKVTGRKVIGIEADEKNIEIAKDYMELEKVNNVVFIHGDPLRAGRYVSEPIFAILLTSPITWLYDIESLVSKAYSLLEYGGTLYGSYPLREKSDYPNLIEPILKLFGGVTPPDKTKIRWIIEREGFHKVSIQKAGPIYFFKASKI